MKSLGAMVKQLEPLLGTPDLNAWEQRFVVNVVETSDHGIYTGYLSTKQIARIEELYRKHFGDAEVQS